MVDEAERQAQARVGCVLDDKWTLERLLGIGGMAAVYAAVHRNGARAAVKVLHADLSRYKDVRERFLREGYAANRVEHPGAVKVLDDDIVVSGPESGTAYLVMELLDGQSLQDRLERGPPVGELEFLVIARSVLQVLEAAHARGVVHRDLKPENLFLVSRVQSGRDAGPDRVKVLDFGLARLNQGQAITSYGLALGTPSFMSPEQAAGRIDEIDGRTDLFALAATGFRICTGRRIHEAPGPVELVRKMASMAAPRVREIRPEVSEACARVIDRALAFRREDRYEDATAMRQDVERALAELAARGPTQLALHPPGSVRAPSDLARDPTTLELSVRDLETPIEDGGRPAFAPVTEESIHIPRRRSVLPWLVVIAAIAIAGKLWIRHRIQASLAASAAIASAPSDMPVVPTPVVVPSGAPSAQAPVVLRDRDGGADEAGAPKPAALAPATTHHPAPGKTSPGAAHKGSKKHHPNKAHPAKTTPTPTPTST